jgi:hypothetical protein
MLTKIMQEGGFSHNDIQKDKEVQELITSQLNS